jgi:hypothetical protein
MCDTIRRTFKSKRMKNIQLKFYVVAALPNIAVRTDCGTTQAADKIQLVEVRQHAETSYRYELKGSGD